MVKRCHVCLEHQAELLIQFELSTRPWLAVETDLFYMDGLFYYYSNLHIIRPVTGSQTVVKILKPVFSEQGISESVISDIGPH